MAASACGSSVMMSSAEIGPAGGTLQGPNGVRVVIPAGALTQPAQISIRTVPASAAPALGNGLAYTGDVYSFEPHGFAFAAPVQVFLPIDPGGANAGVVHASCAPGTEGAAACKAWDAALGGVTVDAGFVSFTTQGFSLYASARPQGGTGGEGGTGGAGGEGGTGGIANTGGTGGITNTGGTGGVGGSGGTGGSNGCTWNGDFVLWDAASLATINSYCEITGNLAITSQELASIELPNLQDIHGDLMVGFDFMLPLTTLSFPALKHVHSVGISYYTFNLHTVNFDSLTTVDEGVSISHGDEVQVSAPALVSVGRNLTLYNGMASLDAPSLESVGGIVELYDLATLNVPKLATVGGYFVIEKTRLTSLDLPSLVSIGELPGAPNAALDLDADAEFGICAQPHGNLQLAAIHAPQLSKLGINNDGVFNIGYNPLLPQCRIDALASQLQQAGWTGSVQIADAALCKVASGPCP